MANLTNKDLRNGALVALDYQTGELVAYVGSANYYATLDQARVPAAVRRRRQGLPPARLGVQAVQLRDRHRRPRRSPPARCSWTSAPTSVATTRRTTPTTSSAARSASATPSSSRSTSRRSRRWPINGPDHVFAKAQEFGMQFQSDKPSAGLALALGVQEVRPVDLVTAYGTLANGGKEIGHTTILTVKDATGKDRRPGLRAARRQAGRQPAGRLHRDRHPGRQHQPERQPVLGQVRDRRPGRPPAGDPQDRHEQRRQGPQRLRLHRAADRRPAATPAPTRSRSASGTATRTTASSRPRLTALLDRCLDVRLAGLPPGGHREVAGDQLQAPGRWPGQGPRSTRSPASSRRATRTRSTNGSSPGPSRRTALAPDTCGIDVVAAVNVETRFMPG